MNVDEELLRAYRLQGKGRLDEAEQGYRRVLAVAAGHVHALNLLGLVCLARGRPSEAVQCIRQAIAQDDGDPEAHANLGLALKDCARPAEAAEAFGRALALAPGHPPTLTHRGNVLVELGRLDEAVAHYREALHVAPGHLPALLNLAPALQQRGQPEGALAAAAQAVRQAPRDALARRTLAEVLAAQHRHDEAAACFRDALQLDPADADAKVALSATLKELGDTASAERLLRDVVELHPQHAQALTSLGVLLEQAGNADGAAQALRQAIAAAPRHAIAHYQLAQLKNARLSEAEVAATQALFDDPAITDAQRAPLAFALACIHDRAGRHDAAFDHLEVGHAIKAREAPYDDAGVAAHHHRIMSVFAQEAAPQPAPRRVAWPQPLFVLGMPRSGTTLTEQILGSHPEVAGAGELGLMEATVAEAERLTGRPYPECVPRLSTEQRGLLGERYRDGLLRRASAARYVVDKTPMNFQYLGFIQAILPAAPIVHCRRDPMDNAWSIFKLPFEAGHAYAHDLTALGRYHRRYTALMAHWRQVLPGRFLDLDYEALVSDFERQVHRLADHVGLSRHPAMLRFHETQRLVKTPSASQVRRPIYRESVAAWRRVESRLGPLRAALAGDAGASTP